ncbi:uncharacterized protein METZ01_LOCUS184185 [marine metagenome]|uniref:Uncharacterized protein n=1 Tax=marine metagenome TaxID=408172 RepID=A0A382D0T6_9ZZZZ
MKLRYLTDSDSNLATVIAFIWAHDCIYLDLCFLRGDQNFW